MDLQDAEDQFYEDMQEARLEGEQANDDAERQLIDDLLLKLAETEKQMIEIKYHLKRGCYMSSKAKINCALQELQEMKIIVCENC